MKTLNKPQKVQERLIKYDKNIIYVNGYENKQSIITIKCKRCGTIKKVRWNTFIHKYSSKTNYEFCDNCRVDKLKELINKINSDTLLDREKHFIEELGKKLPLLEYIGGYKQCENKVLLRCKKCGTLYERTASIIREGHYQKFKCYECIKLKSKQQKLINSIIKKYYLERQKELNQIYKWLKKNTLYIKHCKYCGKEILINNKKKETCDVCRTNRSKHSNKSLRKLYKRDNGICYICNGKCNYDDYIVRDGKIICGDYYPSIDHVISIAKGGNDDWNNLKLAHRICNIIKSDK